MRLVRSSMIQQGQQRGFEVLHLLLRLGAGLGCIHGAGRSHPQDRREELIKELRSLYQGLPMARQALDKGDITGAKEILREMDRYLQDVLWTTVTMPQDPGGAPFALVSLCLTTTAGRDS